MSLAGNRLTGRIPRSFGNLQKLQTLALHRCRLTGEVPASLMTLAVLATPQLSHNGLFTTDATLDAWIAARHIDSARPIRTGW
jgi:hypothetical protein